MNYLLFVCIEIFVINNTKLKLRLFFSFFKRAQKIKKHINKEHYEYNFLSQDEGENSL